MSGPGRLRRGRGVPAEVPLHAAEEPSSTRVLSLYRRPPATKKVRAARAKHAARARWSQPEELAATAAAGDDRTVQWGKLCTQGAMASARHAVEHLLAAVLSPHCACAEGGAARRLTAAPCRGGRRPRRRARRARARPAGGRPRSRSSHTDSHHHPRVRVRLSWMCVVMNDTSCCHPGIVFWTPHLTPEPDIARAAPPPAVAVGGSR